MQEKDLLHILQPIKEYISKNDVTEDDVPTIVQKFFPSKEELVELSKYLQKNLPSFRSLSETKMVERAGEILRNALEQAARQEYILKVNPVGFTDEEIEDELGDYEWEDEYVDDEEL